MAAQKDRAEVVLDEDPLDLGVLVREQRAHEGPVADGVEAHGRHGRRRRREPVRGRPAHGLTLDAVAEHGHARRHGRARAIDGVEEDVDVAPALVGPVLDRRAAAPAGQIADGGRPARERAVDGARRAHDDAHELLRSVVAVTRAPTRRHRITVTVERQLDGRPHRPVARDPDRDARTVLGERPRARAPEERERG